MILEKSLRFDEELEVIIDFIALDSPSRALEFYDQLIEKIQNIPSSPYSYRKRESTKNDKIRELIFKGYTIPFFLDDINNKIIILGIFNQNIWE